MNISHFIEQLRMRISKDFLNLLFAGLAVLFGFLAYQVGKITLTYMRGRDLELDNRNGWIELHKAMVNLRVERTFVLAQRGARGGYSSSAPNPFEERKRDYDLATAQLRGQLDRLNDDPLIVDLAAFLEDNQDMEKWQTDDYEKKFDEFAHSVAMKSRPK
jgi:hypothetical protein